MLRLVLASLVVSNVATISRADRFVYVSIAGENRIALYHLDKESKQIEFHGNIETSGGPGSLAVHPNGKYLLASIRSVGYLASFSIDSESGKLSLINEVSAGADPAYVAVDATGRFLVSAYYRAGKITVHELMPSGKIGRELQSVETDDKAHAAVRDPSNRFWFIPHTGPNAIFQFRFDSASGQLTPNKPARLIRNPPAGPRHLWFHPSKSVAYSSDEQGRSVSTYDFDPDNGTLSLAQTLTTLPPGVDTTTKGSTSDIEVHPSGRFVYVANRGHDSIARYQVITETGQLRHVGNTVTETTTRSFNIDPDGIVMIAAGQKSGKLAVFGIDATTGDLERNQTLDAGKSPWWVQIK